MALASLHLLTQLTPALVSEHSGHEATTAACGRELGRDDGTQRVITTNPYTHLIDSRFVGVMLAACIADATYDKSPDDDDSENIDRMTLAGNRLTERRNNDEHQFNAVCSRLINRPFRSSRALLLTHALAANYICHPTEKQLTEQVADRRSHLYTQTLVGGKTLSSGRTCEKVRPSRHHIERAQPT